MKYEIKNFENEGNNKFVGLYIVDDKNNRLAIDHRIPLVENKTVEEYIAEAVQKSQKDIDEWQQSVALIGMVWNPKTNSLEKD